MFWVSMIQCFKETGDERQGVEEGDWGDYDPFFPTMNSSASEKITPPVQGRNSPLFAFVFLCVAELVAVFLAGGPRQGGMGVFLSVAGLVMILIPARAAVPWWLWSVCLFLLLTAASSLLPQELIVAPPWRSLLDALPALHLPSTITVDSSGTLFWIAMLFSSLMIAMYCLASPLAPRAMEKVALTAVLGCLIYALVAWIAWQTGWHYPFFVQESWAQPAFGFFTNRNQTAGFLLTGAILSLGLIHRGIHGGNLIAAMIAATACALLTAVLLFFSHSRGGLLFLLLGIIIWFAGLGRYRSRLLLLGAGAVMIFTAVLFAESGSLLLQRLSVPNFLRGGAQPSDTRSPSVETGSQKLQASSDGLSSDSRIAIWKDTVGMVEDFPFSGTGLGTYSEVYPFYAKESFGDKRTALHAESDWMTLAAEVGLPALFVAFAGIALLLARIPKLREMSAQNWPLRWAFLSACFAELLHGFVDVPLHKPELGWWVMLLGAAGFGMIPGQLPSVRIRLLLQRIVFILPGFTILGVGCCLIRAQWFGGEALSPFAVAAAQKRLIQTYGEGDEASAKRAAGELSSVIARHPMAHPLYFQLAVLELRENGDISRAKELFQIERQLAPHDAALILAQGTEMAPYDPDAAVSLWAESLRLQLETFKNPNIKDPAYSMGMATGLFSSILSYAKEHPSFLPSIPALASLDPKFRMMWLTHAACDPDQIAAAVADSEFMDHLPAKEQGRLIELWWRRGDRNEVGVFLDSHPQYARAAIATRVAQLAASAEEERACKLLIDTFSIPMPAPSEASPSASLRSADRDIPDEPLAAAQYYIGRGNEAAALRLLGEAMKGGTRAEALRLRAVMEMHAGNWKPALGDLLGYLHTKGEI